MKRTSLALFPAALLVSGSLAAAQAPAPGSVLVFPLHDSRALLTVVSVTNTNTTPGADVRALFRYVNATPSSDPLHPSHCNTVFRGEALTPGDTVSVLTSCHDTPAAQGFLVVSAQHATAGFAVSHDHLVGSALVVYPQGSAYTLSAYSFGAVAAQGAPTDADLDGLLDFDGTEYEPLPRLLFADTFLAVAHTRLALLHLTTSLNEEVLVKLDIQNDNEFPLSYTFGFRCWFELPLDQLSGIFTQPFLASTPDDPNELDISCDGLGELETGWFRIRPLVSSGDGAGGTVLDPPVLGALTAGPFAPDGGRILWGSGSTEASF
jgi:hypothetical protein